MFTALGIGVTILAYLVRLYIFIIIVRVILDWIDVLVRDFRPKGILLVIANLIYALTDKPLHFFGRYIPPLRLGSISLDMGFLVLFFLLYVLNYVLILLAGYLLYLT